MPDRKFRKVRLDSPADLIDKDSGRKLGTIRGLELELDEEFLLHLASLDTLAVEGGLGPEGPGGQQALLGTGEVQSDATRAKFDPVPEVWSHYCSVMKPRNSGLDAQARTLIREALKVATLSECKRAIDGCAASPFHMGENDRHKKYNRLSQILKGKRGIRTLREQIDMFLDIAEKSGLPSGVTSADPGRVSAAKRDVIDAFDFPGDDQVQERGIQARRWLEEQGFKIESHPETGRPMFGVQES